MFDKLFELARRRGIFFASSEIYGSIAGFFDYGPIGKRIKRKLEDLWRKFFLNLDENFHEIETSLIMPEKVFIASQHVTNFVDPMVKCKRCGTFHRADHIVEEYLKRSFEGMTPAELERIIKKYNLRCPKCKGELEKVKVLNLMFPLEIGAERKIRAFLRPETAQGAYVNFLRIFNVTRNKLPLGIAIIGKAFRNEISPRQLLIRQREFTQAELQIFFNPKKLNEHERWEEVKDYKLKVLLKNETEVKKLSCEELNKIHPKFYLYYLAKVQQFFLEILKVDERFFRLRELNDEEKAFYNRIHFDVEIYFPSLKKFKEVAGVHYRTDHDLKGHQKVSKKKMEIFYEGERFIPHVVEISFGIDRVFLALLDLSYRSDERGWEWLALPSKLAPFLAWVFPLVNKDGLPEKALEIYEKLKEKFEVGYDEVGSIGKRYARADEIGVPICITIDHQTLADGTVTLRSRNTTKQIRVKVEELEAWLRKIEEADLNF